MERAATASQVMHSAPAAESGNANEARRSAQLWLDRLGAALSHGESIHDLFVEDAVWRDALAFTWDIRTRKGKEEISSYLASSLAEFAPRDFELATEPAPGIKVRAGREVIEAFFNFRTRYGSGRGVVRLSQSPDDACEPIRAWTLLTTLQSLEGWEEPVGKHRPRGGVYTHSFGAKTWLERWQDRQDYSDHDPEVLIVGGGQAGMMLAARLGQMGVDALLIDKQKRSGDNWRHRYKALTLHNESWVCHLPYMPFPENWPVYLPKDMIAGWFETYAWAMQLNIWNETEFLSASFDEEAGKWSVRVRTSAGERELRPTHLVMATGLSGAPKLPKLPGLDHFAGEVIHTHEYRDGSKWEGQRVLVIGTGNSAHDVAQDLHAFGAEVTIVQRNPTTIVSVEPGAQLVFALYSEGPSVEDSDLLSVSMSYDMMVAGQKLLTKKIAEMDRELLTGLEAAGFRTDIGADETGYYMKYLRTGGGYYLNVGASEIIASGGIKVLANSAIERYEKQGARLTDGSLREADLVVLATGYENMQETARRYLGDEVADKVGTVWGFDDRGDMRGVWKQTGQENLWFMAGSFAQCRTYSRFVALQIKAIQQGLTAYQSSYDRE